MPPEDDAHQPAWRANALVTAARGGWRIQKRLSPDRKHASPLQSLASAENQLLALLLSGSICLSTDVRHPKAPANRVKEPKSPCGDCSEARRLPTFSEAADDALPLALPLGRGRFQFSTATGRCERSAGAPRRARSIPRFGGQGCGKPCRPPGNPACLRAPRSDARKMTSAGPPLC